MKTLRWSLGVAALLGLASLADAQTFTCPATLDPQLAPYGTCICGSGPATCPVSILGNGSLGCSCQSAGNNIQCQNPDIIRCGGILPYCNPLAICNLNSSTQCTVAGTNLATNASDCYIAGIVNPLLCSCSTTTVKLPMSSEQQAAYCNLRDLTTATAALLSWLPGPGFLYGITWLYPVMNAALGSSAVYYGALCQGPTPRTDFTQYAELLPYPAVPVATAPTDFPYQNQADDVNLLIGSLYRLKRQGNVLEKALERSYGAAAAASPEYQEDQLTVYNEAADALHAELLNLITVAQRFNTPRWNTRPLTPDMRYLFEPLFRQSTLDELSAIAAVPLRAN